jgi:FkbM family methyltransferase
MLGVSYRFYLTHPSHFIQKVVAKLTRQPPRHLRLQDLWSVLPTNPTIIEAGASRGMDTVEMARLWPDGRILAFEPEPATFEQLTAATCRFPNVLQVRAALAASTGTATLHVSSSKDNPDSSDASSLLQPTGVVGYWPHLEFVKTVEVKTITVADVLRDYGINRVDFMWLDMQGMEIPCLQASAAVMNRVDRVYSEVSLEPIYAGAPLYPEARRVMAKLGFRVAREYLNPLQGDVLFIRRGLRA